VSLDIIKIFPSKKSIRVISIYVIIDPNINMINKYQKPTMA
jgi:hypothetical protein